MHFRKTTHNRLRTAFITMKSQVLFLTLIIYLSIFSSATGQSVIFDTSYSADYLVKNILVGKGMAVENVKLTGRKHGICYFYMDSNILGMKSGILLSTGNVFDICRPNSAPGTSGYVTESGRKYKSDKDLNVVCRGRTYDVMALEFDFIPFHNHMTFRFVFASEEYREYVGSRFNDVFAFFVNGDSIRKRNLAVIPGTKTPITVNTVNHTSNRDYFINNDYFLNYGVQKDVNFKPNLPYMKLMFYKIFKKREQNKEGFFSMAGQKRKLNSNLVNNLEYDGFTKVITASIFIRPYKKYHMKIAIGDVGDMIFDSGVFLEALSFSSEKDSTIKRFKEYPDLSKTMNFDSIFGVKRPVAVTSGTPPPTIHAPVTPVNSANVAKPQEPLANDNLANIQPKNTVSQPTKVEIPVSENKVSVTETKVPVPETKQPVPSETKISDVNTTMPPPVSSRYVPSRSQLAANPIKAPVVSTGISENEALELMDDLDIFEVTNVYFATASYVIPDSSMNKLDLLAEFLKKNTGLQCQIFGHTDNVGSKKYNQELSENRAQAVINYLVKKGISAERINFIGFNYEKPIADNRSEAGRAFNRRVEILLVYE